MSDEGRISLNILMMLTQLALPTDAVKSLG